VPLISVDAVDSDFSLIEVQLFFTICHCGMTVHLTLSVFGVHNIEDICSKFGKKMQHGHAEMPM